MAIVIEDIINVNVELSQGNTVATVEWTSGQAGIYGNVFYSQGTPNDSSLVYSEITVGPVSVAQNRFSVAVSGLNPALPYSFYVQTETASDVVAEMADVQYLLNPLSLSGVVPISKGLPLDGPIRLGADYAVDLSQGSIPDLSETLDEWYQNMTFEKVGKLLDGGTAFQVIETTMMIPFRGVITPEKTWELLLKPIAQRTWKFYKVFAETVLPLFTDDVVLWQGVQLRVTGVTDWSLYGYMEYELAQDWTSRGPINQG